MNRYGYVYRTTNLINKRFYIGKHVYSKEGIDPYYYGSGKILKQAIQKYGVNNFICEIIDVANSKEELNQKEKHWIEYYRKINADLYNIASGGDGGNTNSGKKLSKEWKEKIRKANTGRKLTEETKKKISDSHKGKTPWNKGIPISEEQKIKLSKANKGKTHVVRKKTPEEIQKMSETMKKYYKEHPDFRERLSNAHKGQKSWCKGLTRETNESIAKRTEKISKKIICIETDKIYYSIHEASRDIGITAGAICMALKGTTKTANKMHWKYI